MRNVVVRGLDINDLDKWVASEVGLWGLPASVYQSGQRTQMDGIWITNPYSGALSGALSGTYIGETQEDSQAALKLLRKSLRNGLFWVSVLTWDGLTLGYGETLVVDPLRRSALLGGSSPAIPSIREWPESLSDGYWTIRYSASEYNQVSRATVTVKEIM